MDSMRITPQHIGRMGLGTTVAREDFPAWCNWVPGADWFEACTPPTTGQLATQQEADIRRVCQQSITNYGYAVGPDGVTRFTGVDACTASWMRRFPAYCTSNPSDPACVELRAVENNPVTSRIFGPGAGQLVQGGSDFLSATGTPWWFWAALGGTALLILILKRR